MIYINSNFVLLKDCFLKINSMGWIESKYKGSGAVGRTFEELLGLPFNEFEIPDFNGIEIKTRRYNSKSYISLFNAALDGKMLFQTKIVVDKYGWPSKLYPATKILYCDINGEKFSYVGMKYIMKAQLDYNDMCIYLNVFSKNGVPISLKEYCWSFELLEDKLKRKLNFLALVLAENKFVNGKEFFFYKEIKFYKLVSFNKFCELISLGLIKISFKNGVYKNGKNCGKSYDHGTSFSIQKNDLDKLFSTVEVNNL